MFSVYNCKLFLMNSNNLKIYCITHKYFDFLSNLNLNIIVGGSHNKTEKFPHNWLHDSVNENISNKNETFGSLTSLYWIWKNELKKIKDDDWVGICHYRRFWLKENHSQTIDISNLNENLIESISGNNLGFEGFVLSPQNLTGYKFMKILKKGKKNIIKNPLILFNKKYQTINLHFDMFHIYNGLKIASNVMNKQYKDDFLNYVNTETKYYPFSIFILKKDKFEKLCFDTFDWIFKCEDLFDKEKLRGYGQIRLFDFLAERFFSFWIEKNTKFKVSPGIFIDQKFKNFI